MTSDLPPTGGSQPPPEPSSAGPSGPAQPGPAPASGPASGPGSPAGPPPGFGASGHGTDEFFNRIRSAGVTRPDEGRWFGGVAAGLARRWDIDPLLIRGGFVALVVFGGIGAVLYGLAWLLLPQDDGRIHLQQAIRGDITAGFVGALILSLTAVGSGGSGPWHDGGWFWAFPGGLIVTAAVIFGIWWIAKQNGGSSSSGATTHHIPPLSGGSVSTAYPPSPAPGWSNQSVQASEADRQARNAAKAQRQAEAVAKAQAASAVAKARRARSAPSKSIVRLTLGIALLAAAAILVVGNANNWSEPVGVIASATALAVVAIGVMASGLSGRRAPGLIVIGLILTFATLAGSSADHAGIRAGQNFTLVGDESWEPNTAAAAAGPYNLGVGEATLSLTDPAILGGATTAAPLQVRVRVGAGHLTVVVPNNVPAQIDVDLSAGDVSYPDGTSYRMDRNDRDSGNNDPQRLTTGPAGLPLLKVDVIQGAGQLDIRTTSGVSIAPIPRSSATPAGSVTPSATPVSTPTPIPAITPAAPTAPATN